MVRSHCPNRPHQPQFHLRLMHPATGHVEFTSIVLPHVRVACVTPRNAERIGHGSFSWRA
jgi:hypothetical protein